MHSTNTMAAELPLSFNQEQALLRREAAQLSGLDARHLFQQRAVFAIRGELNNLDALERALSLLVTRHTALRSTFHPRGRYSDSHRLAYLRRFMLHGTFVPGMFVQRLQDPVPVKLTVSKREDDSVPWSEYLQDAVAADLSVPFDLSVAPLIRATLVCSGAEKALILTTSHITHDAISGELLVADLEEIYGSLTSRRPPALAVPPSHVSFASRECRGVMAGKYRAHQEYWWRTWNQSLAAVVRCADLPFGVPAHRSSTRDAFNSQAVSLSEQDSDEIRLYARSARVTLYALFRALMAIALARCAERESVAFFANFANRSRASDFTVVTWCATSHLVSIRVPRNASLAEVVQCMAESVREAMEHEAVPLAAVWFKYGRDLAGKLDSRINFDVDSGDDVSRASRLFEHLQLPSVVPFVDFDLRLGRGRRLTLTARFNSSRYGVKGVQDMLLGIMRLAVASAGRSSLKVHDCFRILDADA